MRYLLSLAILILCAVQSVTAHGNVLFQANCNHSATVATYSAYVVPQSSCVGSLSYVPVQSFAYVQGFNTHGHVGVQNFRYNSVRNFNFGRVQNFGGGASIQNINGRGFSAQNIQGGGANIQNVNLNGGRRGSGFSAQNISGGGGAAIQNITVNNNRGGLLGRLLGR